MSKERRLGRVASALLAASFALTSCREAISPQLPPESIPFETPQPEVSELPTPEIEFIKDFEKRIASGEIVPEEDVESYTHNLVRGFCEMMDCRGFNQEVSFIWDVEEMGKVWQEEGIEPIALYRTGVTNELARRAPDKVLGPDQAITLVFPDNRPLRISRTRGFALYGTFEEERGEMLVKFNETIVLWASNEFAQWSGLSPVVMVEDKEQLELTQEAFFRLGIPFVDIWPYYRESKSLEFAWFVGEKMGGMTDEKRLSLGLGLLYVLDRGDAEKVEAFLSLLPEA